MGITSLQNILRFYVPALAFRQVARRHLHSAQPAAAQAIWRATLKQQAQRRVPRPQAAPGLSLVLQYLEWDCALYLALQQQGVNPAQAGALIAEINWEIFRPVIAAGFALSGLRSQRRFTRVRWLLDMMFRVVFTAPFVRRKRAVAEGIAFDVTVCPLAAYLQAQGTPELTAYAACSLDFEMAKDWGVGFERQQTLAQGASHCDFHFRMLL